MDINNRELRGIVVSKDGKVSEAIFTKEDEKMLTMISGHITIFVDAVMNE